MPVCFLIFNWSVYLPCLSLNLQWVSYRYRCVLFHDPFSKPLPFDCRIEDINIIVKMCVLIVIVLFDFGVLLSQLFSLFQYLWILFFVQFLCYSHHLFSHKYCSLHFSQFWFVAYNFSAVYILKSIFFIFQLCHIYFWIYQYRLAVLVYEDLGFQLLEMSNFPLRNQQ